MWCTHEGFLDQVRASWILPIDSLCPMVRVMKKLKRLRSVLKAWNRDTFGNYNIALAELHQDLSSLQEVSLQARIGTILIRKSEHLRQHSRITWLSDGGMNTRFFHSMVKWHRSGQSIKKLSIDGVISEDTATMAAHVVGFYKALFFEPASGLVDRSWISNFIPNSVSSAHSAMLTTPHSADDIRLVVFSMDKDSAPSSDGFNGAFFQHSWDVVGEDMVAIADAILVYDYRPIVLGNFFFKVITKILASRLNAVAAEIVSANQFGFISGRSIQECILLASEGVNYMERSVLGQNLALKGDPLSPVLFGLAEEVLSHLLLDVTDRGFIAQMRMSRPLLFPSHFLYVDDVLLFCKADHRSCKMIDSILHIYASVSGQFCNKAKSTVFFGKGVPLQMRRRLKRDLGFSTGSLPFIYLGVPIVAGRVSSSRLACIRDRIITYFPRWQGMQLSMAGRICLVTSVIQSAAVHSMLIFKWLVKHLHDLDRACRSFIWTGTTISKPNSSVAWNRVCAPKAQGEIFGFLLSSEVFLVYLFDLAGLIDRIGIPNSIHQYLMQSISDYFFDSFWNFTLDFLQAFSDIAFDIVSVPIGGVGDRRAWTHSHFGKVTSSLAMDHMRPSFPTVDWGKWIWAPFIPVRRAIVTWWVILGRLLTASLLRRQGFMGPGWCPLCRDTGKDIDHLFWECSIARHIWSSLFSWFHLDGSSILDVGSLVIWAMRVKVSKQVANLWRVGVMSAVWSIWNHQNRVVFDEAPISAVALTIQVKSFILEASHFNLGEMANSVEELLVLHDLGVSGKPHRPTSYIYVFWLPPPHPWKNINIDGYVHGSPPSIHVGGIIHDPSSVVDYFHFSAGCGWAFEGWDYIWIETDCTYLVDLFRSRSDYVPWRFFSRWRKVIHDIADLHIIITHIFREGNQVADFMASSVTEKGYWSFAIPSILQLVSGVFWASIVWALVLLARTPVSSSGARVFWASAFERSLPLLS
ncbi:uncharacterized protein LOC130998460 [Salvia miltiorrhiza]|uniref:uncharacterized protein LOC130998460 n=1 Tax=Salvia miltiorrhiza TaxID=226208 RepID=UPI0025AD5076|nr:uncharacterized protein LOC130998460 [Salvia miltiorrhiza]